MKFSVLMSLYAKERPAFLRQSLDSIFIQTLPPDEVVLVEDGPLTKELYEIVKEYESKYTTLKVIPLNENGGLGKALNEGLKHCSHELVARMDTDDIAKEYRFEVQLEYMDNHPEVAVCSAWIDEFINTPNNTTAIKKVPSSHNEIYNYAKKRCPINHPVVIYRKSAVIESGGYGPFPEDYYLWAKMLINGKRFHNLQESLLLFRSSKDVYKRRGGWNYFIAISKLQKFLYQINLISFNEYIYNYIIRGTVALIPNFIRRLIYTKFLR